MNLGRLIPQIVYYVWAMAQWRRFYSAKPDVAPMVIVPSGNFGNLTAAAYAGKLGIRVSGFVAATNINDTVPEYLTTGTFVPKPSRSTMSNAMDVGNPSNVERLQHLFGHSVKEMRTQISAVSITDDQTIEEIRTTYDRTGIILDPHTAVGIAAARRLAGTTPAIIAATAHPGKFFDIIESKTGIRVPVPDQLKDVLERRKQSTKIKASTGVLKDLIMRELLS
jgi:threonine synthase